MKIGDEVRIRSRNKMFSGKTGVIVHVSPHPLDVYPVSVMIESGECYSFDERNLEILTISSSN